MYLLNVKTMSWNYAYSSHASCRIKWSYFTSHTSSISTNLQTFSIYCFGILTSAYILQQAKDKNLVKEWKGISVQLQSTSSEVELLSNNNLEVIWSAGVSSESYQFFVVNILLRVQHRKKICWRTMPAQNHTNKK